MHPERLACSFMPSSVSFILVRVGLDQESVPGALGTSWEYTQDVSSVCLKSHLLTCRANLETPYLPLAWEETRKPTQGELVNLQKPQVQDRPVWSREMANCRSDFLKFKLGDMS